MVTHDPRVKALLKLATTAAWLRPPTDEAIVADVAEACSNFVDEDGIERRPGDLLAGFKATSELVQRIAQAIEQGGWASNQVREPFA